MAHDWLDCLRPVIATPRRQQPRIPAAGAFCTEISDEGERYALMSDVSATGLRLHRPYRGSPARTLQLEFDLPGIDELIWARAIACFDTIWRSAEGELMHTSGLELSRAASGHLRLLREYTFDHAP